jgi:hypothetical protein
LFAPVQAVVCSSPSCCLLQSKLLFAPIQAVVCFSLSCCLLQSKLLFAPVQAVLALCEYPFWISQWGGWPDRGIFAYHTIFNFGQFFITYLPMYIHKRIF